MAFPNAVDYKTTCFEHPELTKIHGEPTFEKLKVVEDELKANAQSVYSPLGGGQHGHLGLVIEPFQYTTVSRVPFVVPPAPGAFTILPNEQPHVAQARLAQHEANIQIFREVTGVKKALIQQIVQAVDSAYLKPLRNSMTNTLDHNNVYDILAYLFQNHGHISPQKLKEYEDQVREMQYDPGTPVDNVFTAVDNLALIAYRAGASYSTAQKNNITYVILNRTGLFQSALQKWLQTPLPTRTWEAFKVHFRTAHNLMKVTTDETLRDSKFHQANLVQQVVDGVQHLLLQNDDDQAPPVMPVLSQVPSAPIMHLANAVQGSADVLPALLNQMMQMQNMMFEMQKQLKNTSGAPAPPPGPDPGPTPSNRSRRTRYYCWTHGWCFHAGKLCRAKANGHKDEATKENKMNGSTKGYT